jgi:hypothetical protein
VAYQGTVRFLAPAVTTRTVATIRLGLFDAEGKLLHDTSVTVKVLPRQQIELRRLYVIGKTDGKAALLAKELSAQPVYTGPMESDDALLIDDMKVFERVQEDVTRAVRGGARAVFLELREGKYKISDTDVTVGTTKSESLHFVSRDTGHSLVDGFQRDDFKFWYDARLDRPSPLLKCPSFEAPGWERILLSFNRLVAGQKPDGKGHWCICQLALSGRITGNPVASIFARRLLAK